MIARIARRTATLLMLVVVAYLCTTTSVTMLVMPPKGDAVLTADQQTALNQQTSADLAKAFDAKVASFLDWHHCENVAQWKHDHPGKFPSRMVQHLESSDSIEVVQWTYPAAHGEYVLGFCS